VKRRSVGLPITAIAVALVATSATAADKVDFVRDVQPLFKAHCSSCHGEKQLSGLRLDAKAAAFKGGESNGVVIVPGKAKESVLIRLVRGDDKDQRMPPEGDPLTAAQVDLLIRWIDEGANWPDGVDTVENRLDHWSFQPLRQFPSGLDADHFIRAELQKSGLALSTPADRRTLIRRLSLVLHGLAPTPEEVDAFAADPDPAAFEKLVDRLLASPRYGERWARHWLDVIAFGETHGFEVNTPRENAWPYRDYVIQAFNADTPYPRFIKEQLAGDALGVDAATGFIVAAAALLPGQTGKDEESILKARQDELNDMVAGAGGAFLGLTLHCARCHDHKFDPVTQVDYYSLQAIFAGVRHGERPLSTQASEEQIRERNQLNERQAWLAHELAILEPLSQLGESPALRTSVSARRNVEHVAPVETHKVRFTVLATIDGNRHEPCIDELEIFSTDGRNVALASAGAKPEASGSYDNPKHRLKHINDGRYGNDRSWISSQRGGGWVSIEFAKPETIDSIVWGRDRNEKYADRLPLDYRLEAQMTDGSWRMIAGGADRAAPGKPAEVSARRERQSDDDRARATRLQSELNEIERRLPALSEEQVVYAGRFEPAATSYRLHRGEAMQKREPVPPAAVQAITPALSLSNETPEQARRLAFADWLGDPQNPLVARVLVNRLWQHHFGEGLVSTPNDFGRNGAKPSHPELLDWLAGEFIRSGWSIKHMQKLIVMSACWQQSSQPTADGLAKDAQSRLLWRFPPRRLEGETLRDNMLAAAGSLDLRMGGPGFSVFAANSNYVRLYNPKKDYGPAEWRRAIYMTKVRVAQDATFGAFDCPDAGQPQPKRPRSTTPLQALNLFNAPFVLQQADILAQRIQREAGDARANQVRQAFRLVVQRDPDAEESRACEALAREHGLTALCRALLNSNEFLFLP